MSSYDVIAPVLRMSRLAAKVVAVAALAWVAGCTVQPLYGNPFTTIEPGQPSARVASIYVKDVETRPAQQVRNHLIFGFNGGAGQPATPRYIMELVVVETALRTATLQRSTSVNEASAGTLKLTGAYKLIDPATTDVVATGTRSVTASFDRPTQLFAESRALRDAEDRAARELAAFLQIAVKQDLARL